jgi:hypothetical protein
MVAGTIRSRIDTSAGAALACARCQEVFEAPTMRAALRAFQEHLARCPDRT